MNRPVSRTSLLKLAASGLVLGTTMVGCSMGGASHVGRASDDRTAQAAEKSAQGARTALARKDLRAVDLAEAAVAAQPRDAGYRMLLGQAYLAAGRFNAAEQSFADTLTLDPERERAALNLALAQVALGKPGAAKATLADYRDKLGAADFGLALALAGDVEEAVRILEVTTRAPQADAKSRQNLALAYALQGKWAEAKVTAAQDLTPDQADARVAQWASFVKPETSYDQVASLLGVRPVLDAGQPTRLALAPAASPVQTAELVAPVEASEPVPPPISDVPLEPAPAYEAPVAAAAVAPQSALVRAEARPFKQAVTAPSRPAAAKPHFRQAALVRPVTDGRFVVQIGAFSNPVLAERAYGRLSGKLDLASYGATNSAVKVGRASLVRVGIAGFGTRGDAAAMCARVKQSGQPCFVRVQAGDAPARWVQRQPLRVAAR